MAVRAVAMPKLGFDMKEGSVSRWLKAEGDRVTRGEILAEIETDKATVELESFETGVLTHILVQPGQTVAVGTPIASIEADQP